MAHGTSTKVYVSNISNQVDFKLNKKEIKNNFLLRRSTNLTCERWLLYYTAFHFTFPVIWCLWNNNIVQNNWRLIVYFLNVIISFCENNSLNTAATCIIEFGSSSNASAAVMLTGTPLGDKVLAVRIHEQPTTASSSSTASTKVSFGVWSFLCRPQITSAKSASVTPSTPAATIPLLPLSSVPSTPLVQSSQADLILLSFLLPVWSS